MLYYITLGSVRWDYFRLCQVWLGWFWLG